MCLLRQPQGGGIDAGQVAGGDGSQAETLRQGADVGAGVDQVDMAGADGAGDHTGVEGNTGGELRPLFE